MRIDLDAPQADVLAPQSHGGADLDLQDGLTDLFGEVAMPDGSCATGHPMRLSVDLIDEDPEQPRTVFDVDALEELAYSIGQHGVRAPVSVKPHPALPGRWMLNFGARRLRASRMAGLPDIPAFVDVTANSYVQVVENEQRQGLKPMDLALFIKRRLVLGESQAEIARLLGKSRSYVTFATSLIDAPEALMAVYRQGRCQGLLELHLLRKMLRDDPGRARVLLEGQGTITREMLEAKRGANGKSSPSDAGLQASSRRRPGSSPSALAVPALLAPTAAPPLRASLEAGTSSAAGSSTPQRWRLLASHQGVQVTVLVDVVPDEQDHVLVEAGPGEQRRAVLARELVLLGWAPF